VREIRKELQDDSLAEEFIEGREVYVGVVGPRRLPEILPIVELDWGTWDPNVPMVSDRDVKFGPETAGSPKLVMARDISPELKSRLERSALIAYRALKIRDYARLDFRIAKDGEPYLLEMNPNPYLEAQGELVMAAREKGISFVQLIGKILDSAAMRYGLHKKPERSNTGEIPAIVPSPPGRGTG
jgi:D-alanine-D-alanine ligase